MEAEGRKRSEEGKGTRRKALKRSGRKGMEREERKGKKRERERRGRN